MSQSYRMQVAVWWDSLNAKDAWVIDPTFKVVGAGGQDPQGLTDDLALAIKNAWAPSTQVRVRAYELPYVRGAGHVAESFQGKGLIANSIAPRELACCLSFYAGQNTPRRRGRLYIPLQAIQITTTQNRPTTTQMTNVIGFRTMFTSLGGVNVDWTVWSSRDNTDHPVTNVWVDDEWDVIRSRGLQPTTRQLATTSEGDIPNLVALAPGGYSAAPESSQAA